MSGRPEPRKLTMLAVALTSIPPRFAGLPRVIGALRAQTCPPGRILLVIPRSYPRFAGEVPPLPDLPGVEILRCENDPGPIGKLLPAARLLGGGDWNLLVCDDDWLYGPGWAEGFLAAQVLRPQAAICASGFDANRLALARGTRAPRGEGAREGWVDVAQGFGGLLLRPEWVRGLSPPAQGWAVDDIVISAHLARRGIHIWKAGGLRDWATPLPEPGALQSARPGGQNRAQANRETARALSARWNVWR